MSGKTHVLAGILVTTPVLLISKKIQIDINYPVILICSIIGSLFPDIDHPKSIIGRYFPCMSEIIYETCGHRTLTHSFLFVTIIGLIYIFLTPNISIGLVLGMLSHILLDLLTSTGVSIYYPFDKRRIKTSQKNRGK